MAPNRRRAVVLATVATWFLLILVSKLMTLTAEIVAWQALLVVLCVGGATVGQRWARRSARSRSTPVSVA